MKKNKSEFEKVIGITPEQLDNCRNNFTVHKSAKKDKDSFLITKALLDNLKETSKKIGKKPKLIITMKNYTLTCEVTNE